MKRLVPWVLGLCIGAATLAPVTASATAIYEVVANYVDGNLPTTFNFRYSFRMEFAQPPSSPVTKADLIGGDFTNETLTVNGSPYTLDIDDPVNILSWAGGSSPLSFSSTDSFLRASQPSPCFQQDDTGIICWVDVVFRDEGPPIITRIDTPSAVPVPATLALFAVGLAGLGWSRRRK